MCLNDDWIQFIPSSFSKEYLNGKNGIATVVFGDEDKTWPLNFKFNATTNRALITSGWRQIVEEYNFKVGDTCVFEMTDSTNILFIVYIVRANDQSSSEHFQGIK